MSVALIRASTLERRIARDEKKLAVIQNRIDIARTMLMDVRLRAMQPIRHALSHAPLYIPRDLDAVREGQTILYTYLGRDVARLALVHRFPNQRAVIPGGLVRLGLHEIPKRPFPVAARIRKGEPVVVTYRNQPFALLTPILEPS
jgi:antitoxin (DNA-binding transcriptional repressor) of toxin-antitoxin stability system